jgi:hypothetical protein
MGEALGRIARLDRDLVKALAPKESLSATLRLIFSLAIR